MLARPIDRPLRLLTSFHYTRGKNLGAIASKYWPDVKVEMFGDSGAYSAFNAGAPVDVGAYAEWLSVNAKHLRVYANLDVIRSPEGTMKNQAELERRGYEPIPVFHIGSPIEQLERLIDADYPYIALGGMVGKNSNLLMRFTIQCFKLARAKGKGTVFHGFGLTNAKAISNLPWYSVDSSSWLRGNRFGLLDLFDPTHGQMRRGKLYTADVDKYQRLIRTYGGDVDGLRDRKGYHWSKIVPIHGMSWRALETYSQRRHGLQTFEGNDDLPGLHLYLVDAGEFGFFRCFLNRYREMCARELAPGGAV